MFTGDKTKSQQDWYDVTKQTRDQRQIIMCKLSGILSEMITGYLALFMSIVRSRGIERSRHGLVSLVAQSHVGGVMVWLGSKGESL
jgi:hypothetical protein